MPLSAPCNVGGPSAMADTGQTTPNCTLDSSFYLYCSDFLA
jgi:hypothetical protein